MKIIQEVNKLIKQQTIQNGIKYRYSKYCLINKKDNYRAIYNFINDCAIIIDTKKVTRDIKSFLIKNWFLVPEDFNEFELAKQLKEQRISNKKDIKIKNLTTFTILPTTDCNANCAYCFEFGHRKLNMTQKVANDVAEYIYKNKGNNEIKLRWFGGEPLYNQEAIDIICTKLRELNITYSSAMISNGYLVDIENIKKYKDLWKLKTIQITIDGVDDVYNNVKNYINTDDENPFNTVINNIKELIKTNIRVTVRLNVTDNNFNDLKDVVDYMYLTFRNKVLIYCTPIYQLCKDENTTVFENYDKLYLYINKKYKYTPKLKKFIKQGTSCMVNNGHSVVINPLGNISLCEHDIDRRVIGNIYDGIDENAEYIQKYREYLYLEDKCINCKLYPGCLKTPLCEGDGFCNDLKVNMNIKSYKRALNYNLKKFINEQNKKEEQ